MNVTAAVRALELGYITYSHKRPNGTSCFTVLADLHISRWESAENIAYGYKNAASVSEGRKTSSGHYKNIVNETYTKIGIGAFYFNNTWY